jgi:hypothetical protein
MGAFQGGLTYRQYRIKERLPAQWQSRVLQGVVNNIARDLKPSEDEIRHVGWCDAHFVLDTEVTLESCIYNEYVLLGMRVDSLNVPKNLLNIYCEAEERRVRKELKKEALSRYERAEIREQIEEQLKKRILPSIRSTEMVWNWEAGSVRFFSTNKSLNEEFMELFEESFGLMLIPEYAYTLAQDPALNLSQEQLRTLDVIEPTPFVDPETLFETMKG